MIPSREHLVKGNHEINTKEEQLLNAPYGQQGALVMQEEGTGVVGEFYCIMAIRDDVILSGTLTTVNWYEFDGTANPGAWDVDMPMPVGLPFYGDFSQIGLVNQGPGGTNIQGYCSGCPKVIAYYK